MNDYYTIISVNTLKKDLKDKDAGEIPPLPAFKTQSNVEVVQLPSHMENSSNSQNIFLFFSLILFLLIIIYFLLRMYYNMANQNSVENSAFSISNLLYKKAIKETENHSEIITNSVEDESINNKLVSDEKSSSDLLKLTTPKSLEKCIKSFLEITQEK